MNPKYFADIAKDYQGYYDKQYPAVDNCIDIDKQINLIQQDIADIAKRKLTPIRETTEPKPTQASFSFSNLGTFSIEKNQIDPNVFALQIRQKSLVYLQDLKRKRENQFALLDCQNKIETKRQDETAALFTEKSATSEKRILTDAKKKQYFLIGVGSLILLTSLVLITKKR